MKDADELFDVLSPEGEPTGQTKARAQVHKDGDWHRCFHLWIVREGNYLLLQRRAESKTIAGGKLDVTVGGHFRAGETLAEVVREAEEEIGLYVRPGDLHYLTTKGSDHIFGELIDREVIDIYVLRNDQPLEHYYLDCKEVSVLYEVTLAGAIDFYRNGGHLAAAGFDCQQRNNNALLIEDDLIAQAREETAEVLEAIRKWLERKAA